MTSYRKHNFKPCWLAVCTVKGKHWHCDNYYGHGNCVAMIKYMKESIGYEGVMVNVHKD